MSKQKTTKKAIMNNYRKVIRLGYCEATYLLRYQEPRFYTAGVNGWNADIYQADYNTAIVTGYRPFGTTRPDYDLVKRYEGDAKEIAFSNLSDEEKEEKITELLERFLEEV